MNVIKLAIFLTLFLVTTYVTLGIGVQLGKAQTHTVQTIVLPPMDAPPRMPVIPEIPEKENLHNMSYSFTEKDKECMALNIYWEARDQDLKGKLAVGLVTMKRVQSKHYPNTVCGVVWQKDRDKRTGKDVAQFSWTLDGKSDTPKNKTAWVHAQNVASAFAGDGAYPEDFTNGAYLYHAYYVDPYWKEHYTQTAQIGSHLFYK